MTLFYRDRCRTTNNLLGDCYGAAVVEALSKGELDRMDKEREETEKATRDEDLESAKALLKANWSCVTKQETIDEEDENDGSRTSDEESPLDDVIVIVDHKVNNGTCEDIDEGVTNQEGKA